MLNHFDYKKSTDEIREMLHSNMHLLYEKQCEMRRIVSCLMTYYFWLGSKVCIP